MKKQTKKHRYFAHSSLRFSSASLGAVLALLAHNAKAQTDYFTTVTTGSTYSWDDPNWNASANSAPYNASWTQGSFARFYNGAGDTNTVDVSSDELMSGMYLNAGSAVNLIVNAGSDNGDLDIAANATIQDGFGYTQGFLTGGGVLTLNAPIVGTGGVEEESGGGHLQLYGVNTYSGGTLFTSSSTFVDYNNSSSFGSGNIGFYNTTFSIVENNGAAGVNIPNNVQILGGTTGVNFIGNSAVSSGNWDLGGFTVNLRNNGVGTTETLSGVLSDTALPVTYSGANSGKIVLGGVNTYTGATVVGSSGDTAITLQMAIANGLPMTTALTMSGGTFSAGGFNQAMTGKLGLTTSSALMFGAAANTALSFASSSSVSWSGTLNLADWVGNPVADGGTSTDTLEVGTTSGGLTAAQLADIEFDGIASTKGSAALDPNGFVYMVPEPSTIALGVMGGLGLIGSLRRRQA